MRWTADRYFCLHPFPKASEVHIGTAAFAFTWLYDKVIGVRFLAEANFASPTLPVLMEVEAIALPSIIFKLLALHTEATCF